MTAENSDGCESVNLPATTDVQAIVAIFLRCGVVIVKGGLARQPLKSLRRRLKPLILNPGEAIVPGIRGTGRVEMVVPHGSDLEEALGGLKELMCALVGHDAALEFVSAIASYPGASAQEWHRDLEHRQEPNVQIFVPLQRLTHERGPPEFCPASAAMTGEACDGRRVLSTADTTLGDAIVYDPSVIHRGTANRAKAVTRDLLNLSVSRAYFGSAFAQSSRWRRLYAGMWRGGARSPGIGELAAMRRPVQHARPRRDVLGVSVPQAAFLTLSQLVNCPRITLERLGLGFVAVWGTEIGNYNVDGTGLLFTGKQGTMM